MKPLKTVFEHNLPSVCVLLCAALLVVSMTGAYICRLPSAAKAQIATADGIAPLAAPTAVISASDPQEELILSSKAADMLSEHGTVVCASFMETRTEDALSLSFLALPQTYLSDAVRLHTGRMPQNETECVVVPLSAGGDTLSHIGAAVAVPAGDTVSLLTVVGIGENRHALLSHLADSGLHAQILTTDTAAWCDTSDAAVAVLLSDAHTGHLHETIKNIEYDCASEQLNAYLASMQSAYDAAQAEADDAAEAVHAGEIAVLDAENKYNTAVLRASEAEANLLAAQDALDAERQQFYSDMETYEYYSSGQLALIKRRDLAEESFAEQEAAIAALLTALNEAYAARDTAAAYLREQNALQSVLLQTEAEAYSRLDRVSGYLTDDRIAPVWEVRLRTEEQDYLAAGARVRDARMEVLPYLCVSALLAVLLGTLLFRHTPNGKTRLHYGLCALCSTALGALIGGLLLPVWFTL